jgi:hypothetical protein
VIVSLTPAQRGTARWVGVLFLLIVLLQRISLPNQPISVLVVVLPLWAVAAVARGVAEIDRTRMVAWLGMSAITAAVMLLQFKIVPDADVSVTAWGLLVAVWLPFTIRLVERGTDVYLAALRYVVRIAGVLAVLAVAMVLIQLLGVAYQDYFRTVVPPSLQLGGFVITYPMTYGSPIYKSNAFLGLEPSTISAQLGLGLLAAPFVRAKAWVVVLLILGLAATVSGSGILLFAVGLAVVLLRPARVLLLRYAPMAALAIVGVALTPFGALIFSRSTEFQSTDSSTSLRAIEPYAFLTPRWIEHTSGVLLGYGPGSAQKAVTNTNVLGLLVPTPVKVFFEYGLIAGVCLAAFLLLCYWGSPGNAFGLSLLLSLWILQPGTTASVVIAPLLVLVSLWSPKSGPAVNLLRTVDFAPDRRRDRGSPHPLSERILIHD